MSVVDYTRDPADIRDQLEMFLWKFPEVGRDDITALMKEFLRFDARGDGNLDEARAMMLLEARGETKTLRELRAMVNDMDKNRDHKLNFLEWATCHYNKSWEELHTFSDQAARETAMAAMQAARLEHEAIFNLIEERRRAEEEAAAKRAADIEAEAKMTGVGGMSAFFSRQIDSIGDSTKTNEQKIKEAAAQRRALREAQLKQQQAAAAIEAAQKSREQVEQELIEAKIRADEELEAQEAARKAEERARREAFKASQQAKFERK